MNTRATQRHSVIGEIAEDLHDQPGHLIRRAHQIAIGLFTEHMGSNVTPVQYAILRMVHEAPRIDQVGLARRIGLDTSTTALTAARLESKGLLTRSVVENNRRQLQLALTDAGEELLASLVAGAHKMRKQMLAALEPQEQMLFLELLRKFVHLNNEQSRAPLQLPLPKGQEVLPRPTPKASAAGKPRARRGAT
jgi:MarR family transcriptional regulator, temperature-dependent positive regulator of motility